MRSASLMLLLAGCSQAPLPSSSAVVVAAARPEPVHVSTPHVLTPLAGPRVAEVLTAAGEVRDAIAVGDSVWLATAGGLVRASAELVEEARYTTLDGLPSNDAWALAVSGDQLYVATPSGVIEARLDEGRLIDPQLLPLSHARALAVVGGVLWVGTWGEGVLRWDGSRFSTVVPDVQVNRLTADGDRLWVAASRGLGRIDHDGVKWLGKKDGLPDDFVWDLAPDDGGWLVETMAGPAHLDGDRATATPGPSLHRAPIAFGDGRLLINDDGVTRLGPDGAARSALKPIGLPSPDVSALAVGDEALYVGTFDRGVAAVRWDRDEGSLSIDAVEGLIDARINALAVRRGGGAEELWVGTARGASRVRAGQVTHFTVADGLPDDHVNAILIEGDVVRIVTTKGYGEVTAAGLQRVTPESGLPTTRLLAAARASDGALWLGGAHGAARLGCERLGCDSPSWSMTRAIDGDLPDDYVTALLAAGDDLWVGTYSSGLARRSGHRWTTVREPELPSNWINTGALAFWRDRVWVGTVERGLAVSPRQRPGDDQGRWSLLGVGDGLPSTDVTALAADERGLWVGTRGGVARVVMPVVVGGLR